MRRPRWASKRDQISPWTGAALGALALTIPICIIVLGAAHGAFR